MGREPKASVIRLVADCQPPNEEMIGINNKAIIEISLVTCARLAQW
jgi:hypothetical protein